MAFESSCDETAVAVIADGREVLSNVISSQIDIFKNYGGVVPEIAARHHLENVNHVMEQCSIPRLHGSPSRASGSGDGVKRAKIQAFH